LRIALARWWLRKVGVDAHRSVAGVVLIGYTHM
jgi:hypothetical protein